MKALLLAVWPGLFFMSCGLDNSAEAEEKRTAPVAVKETAAPVAEVDHADVATFRKMVMAEEQPQLIDVRTEGEYAAGHLASSVNMNVSDAGFGQKAGQLDPDRKVYVYCAVGGRSRMAAETLAAMGYEVVNMSNGIAAWQAAEYEIVK